MSRKRNGSDDVPGMAMTLHCEAEIFGGVQDAASIQSGISAILRHISAINVVVYFPQKTVWTGRTACSVVSYLR